MDEGTVKKNSTENVRATQIVYYVLGVLEVLFTFRLVFKLLGANPQSPFVSLIYSITQVFLAPFSGIFPSATTKGLETQSVLEPPTIIAMIVYAVIAWGIIKLIEINRHSHNDKIH
jgi:hypothetical protein